MHEDRTVWLFSAKTRLVELPLFRKRYGMVNIKVQNTIGTISLDLVFSQLIVI